ncbi:MAG TPA: hypothetical protein VER55_10260, partial [Ardenticatenaceae bacterium]|nr:hypothetical protein [Ardenticatenaceae bacterium]
MLATDTTVYYSLPDRGGMGYCRAHIYYRTQRAVVVLSEAADNPGPSVAEALPLVATQLLRRYELDVERTSWVLHFPDGLDGLPESYDLVRLTWDGERFVGEPE